MLPNEEIVALAGLSTQIDQPTAGVPAVTNGFEQRMAALNDAEKKLVLIAYTLLQGRAYQFISDSLDDSLIKRARELAQYLGATVESAEIGRWAGPNKTASSMVFRPPTRK